MFFRYVDDQEMYRKAVAAYTSNIPIYVNGYDINNRHILLIKMTK